MASSLNFLFELEYAVGLIAGRDGIRVDLIGTNAMYPKEANAYTSLGSNLHPPLLPDIALDFIHTLDPTYR